MNRFNKYQVIKISYGLWCGLGAYRGIQAYNKYFDKEYKCYIKYPLFNKKPHYYYTIGFCCSVTGLIVHAIPITFPFLVLSEIIDLEKTIRGIKDEE